MYAYLHILINTAPFYLQGTGAFRQEFGEMYPADVKRLEREYIHLYTHIIPVYMYTHLHTHHPLFPAGRRRVSPGVW